MAVRRNLKKGERCPAVAVVHALCIAERFMQDGHLAPSDEFTEAVEAGVIAFQRWAMKRGNIAGLQDDGEVGDKTFRAMLFHLGVDIGSLPDHFWPQE